MHSELSRAESLARLHVMGECAWLLIASMWCLLIPGGAAKLNTRAYTVFMTGIPVYYGPHANSFVKYDMYQYVVLLISPKLRTQHTHTHTCTLAARILNWFCNIQPIVCRDETRECWMFLRVNSPLSHAAKTQWGNQGRTFWGRFQAAKILPASVWYMFRIPHYANTATAFFAPRRWTAARPGKVTPWPTAASLCAMATGLSYPRPHEEGGPTAETQQGFYEVDLSIIRCIEIDSMGATYKSLHGGHFQDSVGILPVRAVNSNRAGDIRSV